MGAISGPEAEDPSEIVEKIANINADLPETDNPKKSLTEGRLALDKTARNFSLENPETGNHFTDLQKLVGEEDFDLLLAQIARLPTEDEVSVRKYLRSMAELKDFNPERFEEKYIIPGSKWSAMVGFVKSLSTQDKAEAFIQAAYDLKVLDPGRFEESIHIGDPQWAAVLKHLTTIRGVDFADQYRKAAFLDAYELGELFPIGESDWNQMFAIWKNIMPATHRKLKMTADLDAIRRVNQPHITVRASEWQKGVKLLIDNFKGIPEFISLARELKYVRVEDESEAPST